MEDELIKRIKCLKEGEILKAEIHEYEPPGLFFIRLSPGFGCDIKGYFIYANRNHDELEVGIMWKYSTEMMLHEDVIENCKSPKALMRALRRGRRRYCRIENREAKYREWQANQRIKKTRHWWPEVGNARR